MIALAVLVVLLAATSASLGILSPRSSRADLHGATSTLLDQLDFARMRATMTNQATEVRFDIGSDPQTITVFDHATSNCLGVSPTVARRIRFASVAEGAAGYSGEDGPMYGEVVIHATEPDPLAGICFRPDGRVTQPNGIVFTPPASDPDLAAGEAQISLRLRVERYAPTTITHNVVVPYNGLANVRYEIP